MDAFVLAGDRGRSRAVLGNNKAFLALAGRPLFLHVLAALDGVRQVDRVFVVGPKAEIEQTLATSPARSLTKPCIVLEQKRTLLENALSAYDEALRSHPTPDSDPPALFLSADIPLVTSEEIEVFIARADLRHADYCIGVVRSERLAPFYPTADQPGIRMAYLHLKEAAYRINNLHCVRPRRVRVTGYIQAAYDLRHQKEFGNVLKTLWMILHAPPLFQALGLYLLARCASGFEKMRLTLLTHACRRFLSTAAVERRLSHFLGAAVAFVETPAAGGALDVDDAATWATLSSRYPEWRQGVKQTESSPSSVAPAIAPSPLPLGDPSFR